MTNAKKIESLKRLIEEGESLTVHSSSDARFKSWKNSVERALHRLYGANSIEAGQFAKLRFFYSPIFSSLGGDYSNEHRRCFQRDLQVALSTLKRYLEEIEGEADDDESSPQPESTRTVARVFISHASDDSSITEELIDILEAIGLSSDNIFCTSFGEYGVDLGEDFLSRIREELRNDSMVLFVLTKRFYERPVCLCEMGAAWVLAKEHIPIIVPPMDFPELKGVIPLTQGFKINDPLKLNLFKSKIETTFGITSPMGATEWERKRDRILKRIEASIANQ